MMASLETKFVGKTFENPFMNASGVHCMSAEELDELAESAAGTFIMKSATAAAREGNPTPRYQDIPYGSINSMGLPNHGVDFYLDYASKYQTANPEAAPIFCSISGMGGEESLAILDKVEKSDFAGITELNLSCPNVVGKPQIAYDFGTTEQLLDQVFEKFTKPLGVKLPPYFDLVHFDQMAEILNKYPIKYINSINSIGNALFIDPMTETVVIKPKKGFGGLGGEYVKPTALANVHAFYLRLKSDIQIIGTGGIQTGQDAFEHLLAGASMLQIGTALHQEGTEIFTRVIDELETIMSEKGYQSIDDFRGKLKHIEG